MSGLTQLKKWLDLEEASAYLSKLTSEPVSSNDIVQVCLSGSCNLSVYLVEPVLGRVSAVKASEPENIEEFLKLKPSQDHLKQVSGLWDLAMFGLEKNHLIKSLVDSAERYPPVVPVSSKGILLLRDSDCCQLLERYEYNARFTGSEANNEVVNNPEKEAEAHRLATVKFLNERYQIESDGYLYVPRIDFPENYQFCIRSEELEKIKNSLGLIDDMDACSKTNTNEKNALPGTKLNSDKPLHHKTKRSLLILIGALCHHQKINLDSPGIIVALEQMIENFGWKLVDDTIRKYVIEIRDNYPPRENQNPN
jgi:hypothetical protein